MPPGFVDSSSWILLDDSSWLMEIPILVRGMHAELRMATLSIVEDLQPFEPCVGPFDAGLPAFGVEQLG